MFRNDFSKLKPPTKTVAVVVPLSNRPALTPDEQFSYRHLMEHLRGYDRFLVAPRGLAVNYPGFVVRSFDTRFFGSAMAHTRLMLSSDFYRTFADYRFILVYHLDALVFSDRLMEWVERDYDYVGGPWIRCEATPYVKVPRVGCGGFSLRKVESFLRVIHSPLYTMDPETYWQRAFGDKPPAIRFLNLPRRYLKRLRALNNARRHIAQWQSEPEDYFWSYEATRYYPGFRICPADLALQFAFEVAPRQCFEMNNCQLPFGCHAWPKYDRSFWEPYLMK